MPFFEYYRKVVETYDKTLGLDYAPDNPYDQNVNARFFVKANAHGVGAAYYVGDHIGVNKPKVSSFFKVNLEDYMKIEIHSLQETQEFATKMADLCRNKQLVITLDGDLGAGKTTWTKSFGKALGVKNVINSPTFTILKDYKQEGGVPFHHIDAYRLEGKCQDLGFEDCFDEGITVVEWSEFIEDQLPQDHIKISFEEGIDENRTVTLEYTGPVSKSIVEAYHD